MRIEDKIREIEGYLSELGEIKPKSFSDYDNDLKTKAACERYFEVIVQAAADLAILVLKEQGFAVPEEENEAFMVLAREGFISPKLAEKLSEAKGMRNIIAHQYGQIDDGVVFESVSVELPRDVREFVKGIKMAAKKEGRQK